MASKRVADVVSQYPLPIKRYYKGFSLREEYDQRPPMAPSNGETYSMFGRTYTTDDALPSLEESGRVTLFNPEKNPCAELLRLNELVLQDFLKLMKRLIKEQDASIIQSEVANLENIFVNMHYIVNSLRSNQATLNVLKLILRQTELRRMALTRLSNGVQDTYRLMHEADVALATPSRVIDKDKIRESMATCNRILNKNANDEVKGYKAKKDGKLLISEMDAILNS